MANDWGAAQKEVSGAVQKGKRECELQQTREMKEEKNTVEEMESKTTGISWEKQKRTQRWQPLNVYFGSGITEKLTG